MELHYSKCQNDQFTTDTLKQRNIQICEMYVWNIVQLRNKIEEN